MFFNKKKIEVKKAEQDFLEELYSFVLEPAITDRERKIGLMAKKDLEKGRYSVAVINQLSASFQQEAVSKKLTAEAYKFYKNLNPTLDKIAPIGTNRGAMAVNRSYLD